MKHILKQLAGLAAITAVAVFGSAGTGEAGRTTPVIKVNVANVSINDKTQLTGNVTLDVTKDKYEMLPEVERNYFPEASTCPAFDYQTKMPTGYYCSVWVSVEQHLPGAVSLTGQNGAWVPLTYGDNLPIVVAGPKFLSYNNTSPLSMPVWGIFSYQNPPWTVSTFIIGHSNETDGICYRVHPQAEAIKIIAHVRINNSTVAGTGSKGDTVVLEGNTIIPNTCYQ